MPDEKEISFIDISSHLGKVRSRIDLIGVEIEGGWTKLPKGTLSLIPDSSVTFQELPLDGNGRPLLNGLRVQTGELASPPMPVTMLHSWLDQHFPQAVNQTCGLHLHMSFKSALVYQRLMERSYQKTVIEFVKRWAEKKKADGQIPKDHPIWERLTGNSYYCQDKFWADAQAATKTKSFNHQRDGNRYTAVNYCYGLHQTVEIRLMSMFKEMKLCEEAINLLIDITNAWLVAGRKIPKLEIAWKLEEDNISEERIECV